MFEDLKTKCIKLWYMIENMGLSKLKNLLKSYTSFTKNNTDQQQKYSSYYTHIAQYDHIGQEIVEVVLI